MIHLKHLLLPRSASLHRLDHHTSMTKHKLNITSSVTLALLVLGGMWLYGQHTATQLHGPTYTHEPIQMAANQNQQSPVGSTSSPTIGIPTATPHLLTANTPTTVTVTTQITDSSLIPGSVNLIRLGTTGTRPTILGQLQSSGNSNYSIQLPFNEPAAGQIQLQISAAFKGALRRVLSQALTVPVWNAA